jgi:dDENN domain
MYGRVQRELFVKAVSSRSISMFLEWFTQTQMFEAFILDKLKEDAMEG